MFAIALLIINQWNDYIFDYDLIRIFVIIPTTLSRNIYIFYIVLKKKSSWNELLVYF